MGFSDFEWDPEYVPGVKLGLHIVQIICGFLVFCLEIAVFRAPGAAIVGNNGWTFAAVFLSIPAWVYLIMTPRFARTRKFAEPHAMLVVDALFTVIWLAAFASQAAYNTANLCGTACGISKAIVAFGVFNTLFFAGSTFISAYSLQYYQFNGNLPGYDRQKIRTGGEDIDPDKAAFSMTPHDEEAYAPVQMDDHDQDHQGTGYGGNGNGNDRRYSGAPRNDYDDDPSRYGSLPSRTSVYDPDTAYRQSSGGLANTQYAPPTAHDDYDDDRPAQFPSGNYDRAK